MGTDQIVPYVCCTLHPPSRHTHTGLPEPYRLTATVPEKFNLQLRIQSTGIRHGAILPTTTSDEEAVVEIAGKVEGDVEVFVRHGDVRVGKLRCVCVVLVGV